MFIIEIYIMVAVFLTIWRIAKFGIDVNLKKGLTPDQRKHLTFGGYVIAALDALAWPMPLWKFINKKYREYQRKK